VDGIRVTMFGAAAAGTVLKGCIASAAGTSTATCLTPAQTLGAPGAGSGNQYPAANWPDAADNAHPTAASYWNGWGAALGNTQIVGVGAGLLMWIDASSPGGTVQFSASFDYKISDNFGEPAEGFPGHCNEVPVTVHYAADGTTVLGSDLAGNLCVGISHEGDAEALYLWIPATAESRLIAPVFLTGGGYSAVEGPFDGTNGNKIYLQQGSNIMVGTYDAGTYRYRSYQHSFYPNVSAGYLPGQDTTAYWFGGPPWSDTGLTWSSLVDMDAAITAADSKFSPSLFHGAILERIVAGKGLVMSNQVGAGGNSESIALIHSFDLGTGAVDKSWDTWSSPGLRWTAKHTTTANDVWFGLVGNPIGGVGNFSSSPTKMGAGPWEAGLATMLKSSSFTSDTSMSPSAPADDCGTIPAGIFHAATPVCVTVNMEPPHSVAPYQSSGHPYENEKWPCPSDSPFFPNDACLQDWAVNDQIMVINPLKTSGEMMVALTVGADQGAPKHLRQITWIRGVTTNIGGAQTTESGWKGYAMPTGAGCDHSPDVGCSPGAGSWDDVTKATNWLGDPGIFSGHSDGPTQSPTPGSSTFCQGGKCRYNIPFATQIGTDYNTHFGNPSFTGVGAGGLQPQSYPSLHQLAATAGRKKWLTNFFHYNPSGGAPAETDSRSGVMAYALVVGTSSVYKVTTLNGGLNYKYSPPIAWSGYTLLQDVSSPTSAVSDATPWQSCWALHAGECRGGSSAGDYFIVVPGASTDTACHVGSYATNYPCVAAYTGSGAHMVQQGIDTDDAGGTKQRNLGFGLTGPSRQYQFSNIIPDPTGQWGIAEINHADGLRDDLFAAQLPADTTADGIDRTNFVNVPIVYGAGVSGDTRRVRFGLAEYGRPDQLFCTPRQESCATDATGSTPFLFASETQQWKACASGCTINVPIPPSTAVWILEDKKNGSTITSSSLRLIGVGDAPAPPSCSYSIDPTSDSVASSSGSGSVAVTADDGCAWTATSNVSWLGTSSTGSGNGTAAYTIAANTGVLRVGTITIAGQIYTVTQSAGAGCTYSISPTSASLTSAGASLSVTVTAGGGCAWTAAGNVSWITTSSTGTGNGTATLTVAANTGALRTGTATIAGKTYTVTQAAPDAPVCTYSIAPMSAGGSSASGSFSIAVTAGAGCAWSAVSSDTWITTSSTGTGNGTANCTVAANSGGQRVATVTIGGQVLTFTQDAHPVTTGGTSGAGIKGAFVH
jgi:hypothetical protein